MLGRGFESGPSAQVRGVLFLGTPITGVATDDLAGSKRDVMRLFAILSANVPGENGMSADGTYCFAYCGETGVGIGVFTIQNNALKGSDLVGGRYSGVVTELSNGGGYRIIYDMFIPAGMFLVQGTSPQAISQTRVGITHDIPYDFANGEPIKLFVPPGQITLMIRKIADDFAWYASGVKLTISPA